MTELTLDKKTHLLISGLEDEILEIIDHQDELTRSDLQGVVWAKVAKILRIGIKMGEEKAGKKTND